MRRAAIIALSFAATVVASQAAASPTPSLIDQFDAGRSREVFQKHPDLVRFTTSGAPDRGGYESLADEVQSSIVRVQTMMAAVEADWSKVVEMRIDVTSASDREQVAAIVGKTPGISSLSVSYRVVDTLPVSWARVGFEVLVDTPGASRAIERRYGASPAPN